MSLALCMACRQFVRIGEIQCPHCREPLAVSARRHAEALAEARAAAAALARLIETRPKFPARIDP